MNLDDAIESHNDWKRWLAEALARGEKLDVATIAACDCCRLGKWLGGEGARLHGGKPAFKACEAKHAAFHCEAGQVAAAINAKDFKVAAAMLETGRYSAASSAIRAALLDLKLEMAAAA